MRLITAVSVAVIALSPRPLSAQTGIMADLRDREYNNVMNNLIDVIQTMPLAQFAYRPVPELRTFGEVVGHIVDVQFRLCGAALPDPPGATLWEKEADARKLIDGFWESVALCDKAFDSTTEATAAELIANPRRGTKWPRSGTLVAMLGHTSRETGKLVTYLRIKGLEPPPVGLMRGRDGRPPRQPSTR